MSDDTFLVIKPRFGISEVIQSGILFTLLGIAFGVGQMLKNYDMTLQDHEKRITKLEEK